jgi:hypothetical protein
VRQSRCIVTTRPLALRLECKENRMQCEADRRCREGLLRPLSFPKRFGPGQEIIPRAMAGCIAVSHQELERCLGLLQFAATFATVSRPEPPPNGGFNG